MKKDSHDFDLSTQAFILKNQLHFTKYFGPKYAYGVTEVNWKSTLDRFQVYARVRPAYQSVKGREVDYWVDMKKFNVWRLNVKLYDFIEGKQ